MEELIISLQFFSLVQDVQNGWSVFLQFFKTENERVNSSRFCQDVKFNVVVLQNTSNKLNVLKCAPLVQYNYISSFNVSINLFPVEALLMPLLSSLFKLRKQVWRDSSMSTRGDSEKTRALH